MAYNYKKLGEVPLSESLNNPRILVEDNGEIKRMQASNINVKPNWKETDPNSPAFILNKPDLSEVGGGNANIITYTVSYTIVSGATTGTPSHFVHDNGAKLTPAEVVEAWDSGAILRLSDADGNRGSINSIYYTMHSGVVNGADIVYSLGCNSYMFMHI